jgi:putative SOS response-associated peptidase YedK
MCGRNSVFIKEEDLEERFDARVIIDSYQPRFNISPQQPHPVISNADPDMITEYRWGLAPQWMDDTSDGFINARSETAHEKPAFRHAWEMRPCLVLSTGFYEWKQSNSGSKQPYRVYRKSDPAFTMAGLWEERKLENSESLRTVTILTTEPNKVVEPIHDRMPVVLPRDEERTWLEADSDERREVCRPYPKDDLETYPISTRVNNPMNDDARVIEPLENKQSDLDEFG